MNLAQKYLIDKNNADFRILNGEAVILSLDNSYYYGLNKVGTMIWGFISRKKNLKEILQLLIKEYTGIPEKQLKRDLLEFMRILEKEKLIMSVSKSA